jgi:hypothetical protein
VLSLQLAAQNFAARNQISAARPIDVLTLAADLPCPPNRPVSVRKLIAELNQDNFTFPVWNFGGGYFSGWTQLSLNADGTGSFKGHAHDSGPVSYDYAVATVLLDVRDQDGNNLAFIHPGKVHGTVEFWGHRDDDWQQDSSSCVVADNWEAVQTSRIWSHILHTKISLSSVVWAFIESIPGAFAVTGLTIFGHGVASGTWKCEWNPPEEGGGAKCWPVQ